MRMGIRDAKKRTQGVAKLLPGLLLCFTIAAAAGFLSDHYGGPVMLFALLLGIAFHFLSQEGPCIAGIEFTARKLLRVGVALLGARVTLQQIESLGAGPLALVISCVVATILTGWGLARLLGRSREFGLLTGSAVAICGASAALAVSSALPQTREAERDTLFTVIAVTTLSTIAMILYPIVFGLFGFSDTVVGVLLGATIHDVAQVVGAGYAVSDEAGDIATYVKLLRVAMLPIVVLILAFSYRAASRRAAEESGGSIPSGWASFPWFAVGFAVLLLVNSTGVIPAQGQEALVLTSRWLLIAAISALGVKTSLKAMAALGARHIGVIVAETVFLASLALTMTILLLGHL
ncbi:putative sulfate exporter family transporter [Roseibium sp. CAU 1637]|uniref:Sulfate exporter family transporter n=1 Tax=Roseibium limicola TaxID=2816037 RepID=A0A939EPS3_9HYPH|nr:putative sulfate exporter family transporter [Roseibium limicola]MBO0346080.1 putative sulfate exporter family transporter [Roseibium limicola]